MPDPSSQQFVPEPQLWQSWSELQDEGHAPPPPPSSVLAPDAPAPEAPPEPGAPVPPPFTDPGSEPLEPPLLDPVPAPEPPFVGFVPASVPCAKFCAESDDDPPQAAAIPTTPTQRASTRTDGSFIENSFSHTSVTQLPAA